MNKRIRKKLGKLQGESGQGPTKPFSWSSQITFGERILRDHYLRLESLQPDHPLLRLGKITSGGHFRILPGFYPSSDQQRPENDQTMGTLEYDGALRDALYSLGADHVLRPLSSEALEALTQKHWEKMGYQADPTTR